VFVGLLSGAFMKPPHIPARCALLLILIAGIGVHSQGQILGGNLPIPSLPSVSSLDKLDPLLQQVAGAPSGRAQVIVRARNAGALGAVALKVLQVGGTLGRQLPIIDAQVANVPNASLPVLAGSADVNRIAFDRPTVGTMERTGPTVGATVARQLYGYDGTGIGVAVIDSGVTAWHDDLTGVTGSQRVDQFVDFVNQQPTPYDDYGHGTHVAGIIAGNGFDSGGARSGIAPAAHLVALKVLDGSGSGRISDVIAAFAYAIDHKDLFAIRVINVSVGAGVYESYNVDLLTLAAKRAVDAGIVVVAAAGNNGKRSDGSAQYGGITAPGNAPWVLTVGASSTNGTIDRADDIMAPFSSRGPTAVDYAAKPDLVAPGVGTESLSDPSSSMYVTRSSALLNGTVPVGYLPYLSLTGTSQAAPVVSGTVALMLQANPALTPNAVKAILQYTAQPYAGYDALTEGAGFLNALGAVQLARYFAAPSASQYPSGAPGWEWGRQIIWGTHRIQGGYLTPDANAWSPDVAWGAPTTTAGDNVVWGVIWSPNASWFGGAWVPWATHCSDLICSSVVWGNGNSDNVVWGSSCGGADCQSLPLLGGGSLLVRSASYDDTVVWGTTGDDTVVWGTTGDDTVVWGTTGDDTVVWGTTCSDPACAP
jgi:serine protease AprX